MGARIHPSLCDENGYGALTAKSVWAHRPSVSLVNPSLARHTVAKTVVNIVEIGRESCVVGQLNTVEVCRTVQPSLVSTLQVSVGWFCGHISRPAPHHYPQSECTNRAFRLHSSGHLLPRHSRESHWRIQASAQRCLLNPLTKISSVPKVLATYVRPEGW